MKKLLITTLLSCFFIFHTGWAQVSIYTFGGVNFNSTTEDYTQDLQLIFGFDEDDIKNPPQIGYRAGVGFNFWINNFFSISPEIMFTKKGSRIFAENENFTLTIGQNLNFIELPVLARFHFGTENFGFYVNAGPHVGYWMGGRVNIDGEFRDNGQTIPFDDSSRIVFAETDDDEEIFIEDARRFELGVNFGGGLYFGLGPGRVLLDARYSMGLTDLQEITTPNASFQTRTFGISLGYALRF
jgi:hypothetical protein